MSKVKTAAANAVERKVEKEKRKAKKKIRKTAGRIVRGILWTGLVLCCGIWIGIHRNVIRAWLKGEALPELPPGHCHCCCKKR